MRKISLISIFILLLLAQSTLLLAKRTVHPSPKTMGDRATIAVTDMNNGVTPTDLVNTILGGGFTSFNIVYTGNNAASGTFYGGIGAGVSIGQGIILTSVSSFTSGFDVPVTSDPPGATIYKNGIGTAGDGCSLYHRILLT